MYSCNDNNWKKKINKASSILFELRCQRLFFFAHTFCFACFATNHFCHQHLLLSAEKQIRLDFFGH